MAEEDGCTVTEGGTVGVSRVNHNRDLLKDCHSKGGGARAPGG